MLVEILEKKLEDEINKVLRQMDLKVEKVEFSYEEKPELVINLKSISM